MNGDEREEWEGEKTGEIRTEVPKILEEIEIEDLTVDGICGVY